MYIFNYVTFTNIVFHVMGSNTTHSDRIIEIHAITTNNRKIQTLYSIMLHLNVTNYTKPHYLKNLVFQQIAFYI